MRVSLFVTCVVDLFAPDAGAATVKVLRAAGVEVSFPASQTCCGQPAWNSGVVDAAAAVARTSLAALEADLAAGSEAVVVPSGSCATMIRIAWPELFERCGDVDSHRRAELVAARTYELSEFLEHRALPAMGVEPVRVVAHRSCHMLRELRIDGAAESLLRQVDGLEQADWEAASRCCGFGGLFSVKLPETSVAMADDKLSSAAEAGAEMIVGCDASCLMHLAARAEHLGRPVITRHLAEVLAEAIGHGPTR